MDFSYALSEIAFRPNGTLLTNKKEPVSVDESLSTAVALFDPGSRTFCCHRHRKKLTDTGILKSSMIKGSRNFLVFSLPYQTGYLPGNNDRQDKTFLMPAYLVENTLVALQKLAAVHRSRFSIPVIGITGSNGKTIVKEWLFQLMNRDKKIVGARKAIIPRSASPSQS